MIEYSYICETCEVGFSVLRNRTEYEEKVKCPQCSKKRNVFRDYKSDLPSGFVRLGLNECRKLHHFAARKSEKMSQDEKDHLWFKQNAYKQPKEDIALPKGASLTRKKLEIPTEFRFAEKKRRETKKKKGISP